jgi:hypothetical protein
VLASQLVDAHDERREHERHHRHEDQAQEDLPDRPEDLGADEIDGGDAP